MIKIVFVGDKYKKNDLAQFQADVEKAKLGLLIRPPFKQRASQIQFITMKHDNRFSCDYVGVGVGDILMCDDGKIAQYVNMPGAHIICLVKGKENGSGGEITVVGNQTSIPEMTAHEYGHKYIGDYHPQGSIMGSMPNQGASSTILTYNYSPIKVTPTLSISAIEIINKRMDEMAGVYTQSAPTLTLITAKIGLIHFNATNTMVAQLWKDGAKITEEIYWERNPRASDSSGIRFFPQSSGTYQVKVKNVNYTEITQTVTI